MKPTIQLTVKIVIVSIAVLLAGCAAERAHQEGLKLIKEGNLEGGISLLSKAQDIDSSNALLRKDLLIQRNAITARLMNEGNHAREAQQWDLALQRFNRVIGIDPDNLAAHQAIDTLKLERQIISRLEDADNLIKKGKLDSANQVIGRVLIEAPDNKRAVELRNQISATKNNSLNNVKLNLKGRKSVTLQFRDANLKMVMEAISKMAALNVLFDKEVKSDLKVSIIVRDTPVEEAIDLILLQTQLTKRVMSENSILIYPDTPSKARDYAELKIRRFGLTNADPKQVMAMVKTMTKTKDMFVDEKTNALVIRDTPQVIRLIERLVASMDQPEPEVMLEIDVMEISRDRALELGVNLPTSFGVSIPAMTLRTLRDLTRADVATTALTANATAKRTDADINDLATPRIRVRNKEKAKFLVGDRLPVISSAANPGTGTTPIYNTNIQYVEVGIKIEVEPTIYADGEVAIKINLEVSSAGNPIQGTQSIAYDISTRSLNTVLRLKDGQTEIMGGLIQDQDRSSAARMPGLGDIPILGRLFGVQTDTKNKKEILLSITPRIVRNNNQTDSETLEMWSGTESNLQFNVDAKADTIDANVKDPKPNSTHTTSQISPNLDGGVPATTPDVKVKSLSISLPKQAKPGDVISMGIALPAIQSTEDVDLNVKYEAGRLRVLSVDDVVLKVDATAHARFTSSFKDAGEAHLHIDAAQSDSINRSDGVFANIRFEVLGGDGATTIRVDTSSADGKGEAQPTAMTPTLATLLVKAGL